MLLFWKENISYWVVALPYVFLGIGVGLAGTPSSNSLTGSVPVTRVGMASGTADLQRDLGGALMTSIFGALLTAGYASAMGTAIAELGEAHLRQHAGDAAALVRERRGSRRQESALREPDHGGRPVVVPQGRPVGVPGRARRDPDRDGARLPLLPEEGRRGRAARRVPRARHGSRTGGQRSGGSGSRSLLPVPGRPSSRDTSLRLRISDDVPAPTCWRRAGRSRSSRAGTSRATTPSSTWSQPRRTR